MREIKFRAWDPVIKSMHYSGEWHLIMYGGASDDVGISIKLHWSIKNWYKWGDGKTQRSINELKWMEYTGLKDASGKPIFEGDVCMAYFGRTDLDKCTVEFAPDKCGQGFYFKTVGAQGCWPFNEHGYDLLTKSWRPEDIKIIGNIHENPELIKSAQH